MPFNFALANKTPLVITMRQGIMVGKTRTEVIQDFTIMFHL